MEGGHLELALEFAGVDPQTKEFHRLPADTAKYLCEAALLGGHFELAERLVVNIDIDVCTVLRACIRFENYPLLEWAIFRFNLQPPNPDLSRIVSEAIPHTVTPDFLRYLLRRLPSNPPPLWFSLTVSPNHSHLTILAEYGFNFAETDAMPRRCDSVLANCMHPHFPSSLSKDQVRSSENFACIQFAFDRGLRWSDNAIPLAFSWVTLEHLHWLVENSTDSTDKNIHANFCCLTPLIPEAQRIDLDVLKYVIAEKFLSFKNLSFALVTSINNIEVLDLLWTHFQKSLESALEEQLDPIVNFLSDLHNCKELPELGKFRRRRYHNWICLLRWFFDHGISSFNSKLIEILKAIGIPYFQRELQLILCDL